MNGRVAKKINREAQGLEFKYGFFLHAIALVLAAISWLFNKDFFTKLPKDMNVKRRNARKAKAEIKRKNRFVR